MSCVIHLCFRGRGIITIALGRRSKIVELNIKYSWPSLPKKVNSKYVQKYQINYQLVDFIFEENELLHIFIVIRWTYDVLNLLKMLGNRKLKICIDYSFLV